jgi:hypothetical protein
MFPLITWLLQQVVTDYTNRYALKNALYRQIFGRAATLDTNQRVGPRRSVAGMPKPHTAN